MTTHAPLALRRRLLAMVGGDERDSLALLLFLIALHDIGKYTPGFQVKLGWATALLRRCGFDMDPPPHARHHGAAGVGFVRDALEAANVPPGQALSLARAVMAHHGAFPTDASLNRHPMGTRECGKSDRWNVARHQAIESLRAFFQVGYPSSIRLDHADVMRLAGLTAVADWIGSMEDVFQVRTPTAVLGGVLAARAATSGRCHGARGHPTL